MFGYAALAFGIFSLISVDMVYKLLQRKDNLVLHSGMVSLTGILLFAWMAEISILIEMIILLKCIIYVYRKRALKNKGIAYIPILSLLRILCLLIPYILLDLQLELILPVSMAIVLIGEIIDRAEFYYESDVITPEKQLRINNYEQ
jgi:predicted membrane protein